MARNFVAASSQTLDYAGAVLSAVPITMACWAKPVSATTAYSVMAIHNNAALNWFYAAFSGSGFEAYQYDGSVSGVATVGGASAGVWQHTCAVFASNSKRTAYLNGVAGASDTTVCSTPSGLNKTSLGIVFGSAAYFNGDMAEAAIWSAELTATEVAALAAGVSPLLVRPGSLVAYWKLYGVNSPEPNLMVGGYNLVLNGPVQAVHPRVFGAHTAMKAPRLVLTADKFGWRGEYPDLLLDTSFESVDSGFIPRSPQDPFDPTPN